jgi:hypothetical protein
LLETSAGYVLSESTATTWSPAPIAYNISVAVGDKLTIFKAASGAIVVPAVSVPPPHAARETVATIAAVKTRQRE